MSLLGVFVILVPHCCSAQVFHWGLFLRRRDSSGWLQCIQVKKIRNISVFEQRQAKTTVQRQRFSSAISLLTDDQHRARGVHRLWWIQWLQPGVGTRGVLLTPWNGQHGPLWHHLQTVAGEEPQLSEMTLITRTHVFLKKSCRMLRVFSCSCRDIFELLSIVQYGAGLSLAMCGKRWVPSGYPIVWRIAYP